MTAMSGKPLQEELDATDATAFGENKVAAGLVSVDLERFDSSVPEKRTPRRKFGTFLKGEKRR